MSGDDKLDQYETLFPRQAPLDMASGEALPGELGDDKLVAAVGGEIIDFRRPPAVRLAAQRICELADIAARREALAAVPAAFRDTVRILVERAFYNRRRLIGDS